MSRSTSTGQDDVGPYRRLQHALFRKRKKFRQALKYPRARTEPQRCVYVAGCQRSGTNLVVNVLELNDATDVYHERDPRAFDDYYMRPDTVIDALKAKSRAPFFVIKCLLESDRLAAFLDRSDNAKGLWVYRHFNDVVRSLLASWPDDRNDIDEIVEERCAGDWRARGLSDGSYATVRRLYRPDIDNASAQALFWLIRNSLYFDNGFDKDTRILLVRFDDLVDDSAETVTRIADFLDMDTTSAMLDMPNRGRVRKKSVLDIDPAILEQCEALRALLDETWERAKAAR